MDDGFVFDFGSVAFVIGGVAIFVGDVFVVSVFSGDAFFWAVFDVDIVHFIVELAPHKK